MAGLKMLLVDARALFLDGMRHLLEAHGYRVAGTVRDGLEALEKARALRPDVVLMDVLLPQCDGLQAARLIKAEMPQVKVVMLTTCEDDHSLFEALRSGVSGYLLKHADGSEVLHELSRLDRGEPPLGPGVAARLMREVASRPPEGAEPEGPTGWRG